MKSPTKELCTFAKSLPDLSSDEARSVIGNEANKLAFPSHPVFGRNVKLAAISKAFKIATGDDLHIGL